VVIRGPAGLHRDVCAVGPGPHDPMTRFPPQVDKPVDGRDHHHPADQIAERDRGEIVEDKAGPRQLGESLRGWARLLEDVRVAAQEQGDGDEIHVGDRVLEAGRDKGRNRGDDRQDLVGRRARAETQSDGQTHQGVAEDAEDKGRKKAVVHFGSGAPRPVAHQALGDGKRFSRHPPGSVETSSHFLWRSGVVSAAPDGIPGVRQKEHERHPIEEPTPRPPRPPPRQITPHPQQEGQVQHPQMSVKSRPKRDGHAQHRR
jgi:hypothetical protein